MSPTVVVKGGSARLCSKDEAAARQKRGWKLASDLPKLDQQLLRDRFEGHKDWLKALEPAKPKRGKSADS